MMLRPALLCLITTLGVALASAGCSTDDPADADPDAPTGPDAGPNGSPDAKPNDGGVPTAGAAVFDLDRLHEINIVVAPEHLDKLENDRENRVPCTFTFDGKTLSKVGIRQKGGAGSSSTLDGKPGFSLKLNELVKGQKLDGLDKLTLNNAIQDASFLHEHLGYEIYRAAGIPAARTAHAIVTLNGRTYGIYVIAESIDKDFLRRNFDGKDKGNLYESPCCSDFVSDPDPLELKDADEGRKRDDLNQLAATIRDTSDDQLVAKVGALLDLDNFITGYAIDTLVDHWDGYSVNNNNYYMYHRPSDGRFVFMPHGMDQLFQGNDRSQYDEPSGELSKRVRRIPDLNARYQKALDAVLARWDVAALHARMDRVAKTLHTTTRTDERVVEDLAAFDANLEEEKRKVAERKPANGVRSAPAPASGR